MKHLKLFENLMGYYMIDKYNRLGIIQYQSFDDSYMVTFTNSDGKQGNGKYIKKEDMKFYSNNKKEVEEQLEIIKNSEKYNL